MNAITKCPKCGKYMKWYMRYNAGMPVTGWKCVCGHDTAGVGIYCTDSTKPVDYRGKNGQADIQR